MRRTINRLRLEIHEIEESFDEQELSENKEGR